MIPMMRDGGIGPFYDRREKGSDKWGRPVLSGAADDQFGDGSLSASSVVAALRGAFPPVNHNVFSYQASHDRAVLPSVSPTVRGDTLLDFSVDQLHRTAYLRLSVQIGSRTIAAGETAELGDVT